MDCSFVVTQAREVQRSRCIELSEWRALVVCGHWLLWFAIFFLRYDTCGFFKSARNFLGKAYHERETPMDMPVKHKRPSIIAAQVARQADERNGVSAKMPGA